jgi:F-type H+-transporting ATPase subunit a
MAGHHDPTPMGHVQDEKGHWTLFHDLFGGVRIPLGPTLFDVNVNGHVYHVRLSKFMVLELIAAILIIVIFVPLCRRAAAGGLPKGPWWNAFEVLLTFVRDQIAKPALGEKDADTYVPYLWTTFLFVLFLNLFGLFPFLASPTASIWVTGALALISFCMMHGAAMVQMGVVKYFTSMWPHIEIVPNPWRPTGAHGHGHGHGHDHAHDDHAHAHAPQEPARQPSTMDILAWVVGSVFGFVLCLMIYIIEMGGTFIKAFVLAVRLYANMFGGHMVLATILFFIYMVGSLGASYFLWGSVTVASVLGVAALSLLELFVAFLQAYVFTFLTALFMGMSLHPQH